MGVAIGAHLGLPTSQAEQACSLRPQDYAYGQPSQAVLQRLQRQLSKGAGAPAAAAGSLPGAFGAGAALAGERAAAARHMAAVFLARWLARPARPLFRLPHVPAVVTRSGQGSPPRPQPAEP